MVYLGVDKHFTAIVVLLFLTTVSMHAIDTDEVVKLGLPVLIVETNDSVEPTCDYVFAPEGAFGIGTANHTKVPGRVLLIENGDTLFDSGSYVKDRSGMTIRIRGNTSAYYSDKKPFKIKLEKKNDMLARGDSAYYDKNWALIRDGDDALHTMIGNKINELVGMTYTPAYLYVNVMMNGDYRGIYMLTETIRRNRDCRIDVDKQTGFIIERDAYWWNEPLYFKSRLNMEYTFKYPDDEDVTTEQLDDISQLIDKAESAIEQGTYEQYFDLNRLAAWLLAHDILGTYDSGGANIYLTKYDSSDTSLLSMSTLWDFGSSFRLNNAWSRIHTDPFFYYPYLFDNNNTLFVTTYIDLWNKRSADLFRHINTFIDDFSTSKTAQALQLSRPYDHARWHYNGASVNQNVSSLKRWFDQRQKWMQQAVSDLESTNAIVNHNSADAGHTNRSVTYNLSGQHTTAATRSLLPGIYIRNGRKVVRR